MSSKIEQIIDEIEEYIDNCALHNFFPAVRSLWIVMRLTSFWRNFVWRLRRRSALSEDYRQSEARILADAKAKAEAIIAQAQIKTGDELVSEHQIIAWGICTGKWGCYDL